MASQIKIITVPGCPWCEKAIDLALDIREQGYDLEIIKMSWGQELREVQSKHEGWKTVPMVYIDESFIGGFTDFKEHVDARQEQVKET